MRLIHFTGKVFLGWLFLIFLFFTTLLAQQDTTRNDHFWLLSDSVIIDWTNPKQPSVFKGNERSQSRFQTNTAWSYANSKGRDCLFTSSFYDKFTSWPFDTLPIQLKTFLGNQSYTTHSLVYPYLESQILLLNTNFFQLYFLGFISEEPDSNNRTILRMEGQFDSAGNIDSSSVKELIIDELGNQKPRLFSQGDLASILAIKTYNNKDWRIISHSRRGNTFYSKVASSSDSERPDWAENIGQRLLYKDPLWSGGTLITTRDGKRIALISSTGFTQVFDHNRCTGTITPYVYYGRDSLFTTSATNNIQDRFIFGAFSPNGTKLYIGTADSIFQLDLYTDFSLKDKKLVTGLDITLPQYPYFFRDMEIAPDKKIYISKNSQYPVPEYFLSVIALPDSHVSKCAFQEQGLSLFINPKKNLESVMFPNIANNSMLPQTVTDMSKIFPYPAVVICPNTPIRIGNASDIKHEWFFDTALPYVKQMEQSNYYIFQSSKPGRYTIKARVETQANPCWQDTVLWQELTIIVRPDVQEPCLAVSRPEIEIEEPIKVYPNPASEQINIRGVEGGLLTVYDVQGRLVYLHHLADLQTVLNVESWQSGFYIFCIQSIDRNTKNANLYTKTIIIIR